MILSLLLACADPDDGFTHGSGQETVCGPGSCAGCCTEDGECVFASEDQTCGDDGYACGDCGASGTTCQDDVCVNDARTELGMVDDSTLHVLYDADAERLRHELIEQIWGEAGFPEDARPDDVEEDVSPPIPTDATQTDRLTVDMGDGYVSLVYVFYPAVPSGELAIVHQGHSPTLDVSGVDLAIGWLLDRGAVVLAHYMPLTGEYTGPAGSHDELFWEAEDSGDCSPMALFLTPVAASLGWALDNLEVDDVMMTGVSGGGWTTTVYAALDPRVRWSLPVAGSLPLYLREESDLGDMEQYYRPFYSVGGYLDLYVLGGWGEDREQIQILNRYDSCCFWGERYQDYAAEVETRSTELDAGRWRFFLDESHTGHEISEHALEAAFGPLMDGGGVEIVDDLAPAWGAFAAEGDWSAESGWGFDAELLQAPAGSGASAATWSFSVSPGTWEVYATWTASEDHASDAPYTLSGDEDQPVSADQRREPADLEANGVTWALLGAVQTSDGALTVRLTDAADGAVIADAIRVSPR